MFIDFGDSNVVSILYIWCTNAIMSRLSWRCCYEDECVMRLLVRNIMIRLSVNILVLRWVV